MNDIKVFSNTEFGELGVMIIDGKEHFPATQCARLLGYKDPHKAIKQHCKPEGWVNRLGVSYTTNQHNVTTQQVTEIKYINEGNLYRLIVSSKLPAAEKFERWVFEDVLPSIRKTGGYGNINLEKVIAQTATAVVSEVVKQLVPVLKDVVNGEPEEKEIIWETKVPKKRKPQGVIVKLAPEIRAVVDEMLLSACSYKDVKKYLGNNGIGISEASICRYYNNVLA